MNYSSILTTLAGIALSLGVEASEPILDLPLGMVGLEQIETSRELEVGLTFHQIKRGTVSQSEFYTFSSGVVSPVTVEQLTTRLVALGYEPRIELPAEFGPRRKPLGSMVRVGHFVTKAESEAMFSDLLSHDFSFALRHTSEDGHLTSGPFIISVLRVDLELYKGQFALALGQDTVAGKESISSMSSRYESTAAVNAGFFAWNDTVGVDGDPAGVAVIDGSLVSEPVEGRPALIIDNYGAQRVWIAHDVHAEIRLQVDETDYRLNGLNRAPGRILNCGGLTETPTDRPAHDFVCMDPNESIAITTRFGAQLPDQPDFHYELPANDHPETTSTPNDRNNDLVRVVANGTAATELAGNISPESIVRVQSHLTSAEGEIPLAPGVFVANGGPTLIRDGRIDWGARAVEGWDVDFDGANVTDTYVDPKDKATTGDANGGGREGFYNGWVVRRHPRTAIGITANNVVYLVVVYGRQPGTTAGANITEMARIMQALGATEALNLDGGGSTAMVVRQQLTGPPSDHTGERPVGDALLLISDEEIASP